MTDDERAEKVTAAAVLILTYGRWWLMPLSTELLARGARGVINSPQYRAELFETACRRWNELGRPQPLGDLLSMADQALSNNDERTKP